jgi:hypothetical protein
LEFKEANGKLQTYYKGILVNWEEYCRGINEPSARMIMRRFEGGKIVGMDKCVNGFLFGGDVHEHSDVRHLVYGP